jgi:ribonuclease Z
VFAAVKPKLAVYSHIVRIYGYPTDEILPRTKEKYPGRVMLGEDLMSFTVGDTVTMQVKPSEPGVGQHK